MRAIGMLTVLCACGDSVGPGELPATIDTTCYRAEPGGECAESGWCRTTDQCGEPVRFCECTGGEYRCTDAITAEEVHECSLPRDLTHCWLEGTGACDVEPVGGGSCGCDEASAWRCENTCDGCPDREPVEGSACSGAGECRYSSDVTCSCAAGSFHCVAS